MLSPENSKKNSAIRAPRLPIPPSSEASLPRRAAPPAKRQTLTRSRCHFCSQKVPKNARRSRPAIGRFTHLIFRSHDKHRPRVSQLKKAAARLPFCTLSLLPSRLASNIARRPPALTFCSHTGPPESPGIEAGFRHDAPRRTLDATILPLLISAAGKPCFT